jgi:hypothetical protein
MSFKTLKSLKYDMPVKTGVRTFTTADLSTGTLTLTHPHNTKVVEATVFNPDGSQMEPANFNINVSRYDQVRFDFGGSLPAGNLLLILKFYIV